MNYDRVEVIYAVNPDGDVETVTFDDIPTMIPVTSKIVKDFDRKLLKQVVVPKEWAMKMVDLNDLRTGTLTRLKANEKGETYVTLIPMLRPDLKIDLYFGASNPLFVDAVEEIDSSIDFCDYCGYPRGDSPTGGYCDMEGGGVEIETWDCQHCETTVLRFLDDWLKWHPRLHELLSRYQPSMIESYAKSKAVKPSPLYKRQPETRQQRLRRHG